ncbi:hypothetical protein HanRHA438_Chr07g0293691 [Helianthus annuus]|nr:hypothetical protein HanRHA438_Chr07g0293691 [Helianthus annuus]
MWRRWAQHGWAWLFLGVRWRGIFFGSNMPSQSQPAISSSPPPPPRLTFHSHARGATPKAKPIGDGVQDLGGFPTP